MAVIEIARIQVRRGQENQTGIPLLSGGEFAWGADTENLYIGLRREDGGARDANIRVLTENDLRLFTAFVGTGTTAAYTWETDSADTITSLTDNKGGSYLRSIADKLDDLVSIADFGVLGTTSSSLNDCTVPIQAAIDHLFIDRDINDPTRSFDDHGFGRYNKKLFFPAGTYKINGPIFLPKNAVLVGEGIDKTILEADSTGTTMFQTVDYLGRINDLTYRAESTTVNGKFVETPTSIYGPGQPKNIHIEGMTLKNTTSSVALAHLSLLSLDCVDNAVIRQVKFSGNHSAGGTVEKGNTGIDVRGYGIVTSENILIDACQFDRLYYGVRSNYDTKHITVQNSVLTSSSYGIAYNTGSNTAMLAGPAYSRILNNKFYNIEHEAIYAGPNINGTFTNHISMNNVFVQVGNLNAAEGQPTGTPIITFSTRGNSSVNDFFSRQRFQDANIGSTTTTYLPLIEGRAVIDNSYVNTATLAANGITPLVRLPVTTHVQYVMLKYTCAAPGIDKMGTLHVYIRPDVDVNLPRVLVTDDYNALSSDGGLFWGITFDGTYKYFEIFGYNPQLTQVVDIEFQTKIML